ncbi:MAG: beta-mannanase-like protein [Actinomycetia bacterium]|nr:beta-mannanase-like protein [Actinomycetes bacterium]
MRRLVVTAALLAVLATAPLASANVILGVHGNAARFAGQTGQDNQIRHTFMSFDQGGNLAQIVSTMGPIPMLALNAGAYGAHESATPQGLAMGRNDRFLYQLNAQISAWTGDRFYVRPFPEMNGHWESTCAFNKNGTHRDAAHSTLWNRKALARIAVVLRGGTQAEINGTLATLGLPGIDRDLPVTTPKLRIVWNPQGFGSPDVPGNSAQAYYPGDAYIDVIGDDLYDIAGHGATWAAAEKLYKAHPSKPFSFPEWGLWGFDDATFIRDMAKWLRSHKRVEFAAYFSGKPGSVWDLASKPASRSAYRALITPLG